MKRLPDDRERRTGMLTVLAHRPSPPDLLTSTTPVLHCCETWHVRAREGVLLPNRPEQPETWAAIRSLETELLEPLEKRYGIVTLTYGFAGPELVAAVQARASAGGWLPNITPHGDQHAGHELNARGNRICKRDGIAVDLRVPGQSSLDVAKWVIDNLRFDRIYLYAAERAFHMSWAPDPVGQVVEMCIAASGAQYPKVVVKGRREAD